MSSERFDGFDSSMVGFLRELGRHNERPWFDMNKARYEALVREPALAFISAMAPRIERISPHFRALPKRVGGSLMRVYRDTRFSRDKRPYKTNVGIQFRHALGKDVHAPGFYVHVAPEECFLGAGMWRPEPAALARIRDRIVANPVAWADARDDRAFSRRFELTGERLKRPPRGYDPGHPMVEDLKRKDFIAIEPLAPDDPFAPDFVARVTRSFQAARPLMAFLCAAQEVPY
jgi:uncharacterized protein (TIGR02453 family)